MKPRFALRPKPSPSDGGRIFNEPAQYGLKCHRDLKQHAFSAKRYTFPYTGKRLFFRVRVRERVRARRLFPREPRAPARVILHGFLPSLRNGSLKIRPPENSLDEMGGG